MQKIIGGAYDPLLPEIFGKTDLVGAKNNFFRFMAVKHKVVALSPTCCMWLSSELRERSLAAGMMT